MRFLRFVPAAPLALLAACASTPEPPPAPPPPAPTPTPTPPPPPPAPTYSNWEAAPQTPGDWRWRSPEGASIAEFASPQGPPVFQIACTTQGVFLSRVGGGGATMTVRTETVERTLPANPSGMFLRTLLDPRDPLLDAIAFSKGRFAIETGAVAALYLPSYPEISRVIEDCR